MSAPARGSVVLYTVSATCAVIGALLWLRGQADPPRVYGAYLAADSYTASAWRVWSPAVPDQRLGLYLVVAAVVTAAVARWFSVRGGRQL
ncbi:hypothetical protein ABZ896_21560 [Streptomyces sp. NPDC047072]|uniref:hypothetical protein n=1 Tax=Streptomyces sp. NPDC047072 TaxID=3154809 RepID=UPI00340C57CF